MNRAYPASVEDPGADCPVPLDLVALLMRTKADALPGLVSEIPEMTRARLAVWLYGRSHTHAIGIRIAATCEGSTLRQAAGFVGNTLYDLSRQCPTTWSYGPPRTGGPKRVSLGGGTRQTA